LAFITQRPLDACAQEIARVLLKKSLGIPRPIQILHHVLAANREKLLSGELSAKSSIFGRFTEVASMYFSYKGFKPTSYRLSRKEWERLVIEASFCMQKEQHDVIG
jgi:hypothetical protein